MRRASLTLIIGIVALTAISTVWALEENPLSVLPLPQKGENILFLEISDVSLIAKILNSNWFKNLAINVGDLSSEEVKSIETAAMIINKNIREVSWIIYFKQEVKSPPYYFITVETRGNAHQIFEKSGLKLKKEKGLYRADVGEKKKLYAYFNDDYVILSDNREKLTAITDPIRNSIYLIWKTGLQRRLKDIIPSHERCQIYLYSRMDSKIAPGKPTIVEGRGKDEKTRFVFDLVVLEPKEGLKTYARASRLLPISPPGKGTIVFMGAISTFGKKTISAIKNLLPERSKNKINDLYKALSTDEKELSRFLTGKFYFIMGGNSNIMGASFIGIYAYYLSEMNPGELKAFLRKAISSAMKRSQNGNFLKEVRKVGWDLFYTAIMPIDLVIGVRGKEMIIGLISPNDLDFRMILPPDISEEIGEPLFPWAYLSFKNMKDVIPKFVNLVKNFNSDKETIENISKLNYLIPSWRGILFTTQDPNHARIQVLY